VPSALLVDGLLPSESTKSARFQTMVAIGSCALNLIVQIAIGGLVTAHTLANPRA